MGSGLGRLAVFLCAIGLSCALQHPVVVGKTFLTSSIDPRVGSNAWALTSHGIAEKLFTVDEHGDIVGQVGQSVTKVSNLVWDVTLKPDYKFSDGTQVNAMHVADCLNELNRENDSAKSSLGSITVSVRSELTVRIESERPTHVMDAVLAEWVFAIYFETNGKLVFTGPYAVETFVPGNHIDLVPNLHYPQATERPLVVVKKFSDGHALAQAVEDQEVDIAFHLPIDRLPNLRNTDGVLIKSFEVGYHYMMFHNLRRPQMADLATRQAIDLAIDRTVLSQALAGGRATRSLFPDFTPYFSDDSDPHGAQNEAEVKLDAAGWTRDTNGKRTKDGQELTVKLVAYPHRPGLVIMQPLIEQALTALGITVNAVLTGQDWSETQTIIDSGDYDLLMWAQNTLPAGDPAWFLNSFFRSDGGNNHAGFASDTVDALLDAMLVKEVHADRVAATEEAHTAILEQVPVSNLVTPSWHVGLSDRVATYRPWGSDYYVIRSDLRGDGTVTVPPSTIRTPPTDIPPTTRTSTPADIPPTTPMSESSGSGGVDEAWRTAGIALIVLTGLLLVMMVLTLMKLKQEKAMKSPSIGVPAEEMSYFNAPKAVP